MKTIRLMRRQSLLSLMVTISTAASLISGAVASYYLKSLFGNGRATSTDSPGLLGSVNAPMGLVLDVTENFLYFSDANAGGLIRKLLVTDKVSDSFRSKYYVRTVFVGVNCNQCQFLAISSTDLYVSSQAHNIKALKIQYEGTAGGLPAVGNVIVGSLGDTSCSNSAAPFCSGDADGVGTFARYNTIRAIAIQFDVNNREQILFLADQSNNKIRMIDLSSGSFESTTFASLVDPRTSSGGILMKKLQGLAVNSVSSMLYAAVTAGIYSYSIADGEISKRILAGRLDLIGNAQGFSDGSLVFGARIGLPNYLTLDGTGNLYFCDHFNNNYHSVRRISLLHENVTTIAGKTSCLGSFSSLCFTPDGPPESGDIARLNAQTGIAISKEGTSLYVADTLDHVIREIYCDNSYMMNGECIALTDQPSQLPTSSPSQIPSENPSPLPSVGPSYFPSIFPSVLPSHHPTQLPSINPSHLPSWDPSISPTCIPSTFPTSNPTSYPSTIPSELPSIGPTETPSKVPSYIPSSVPTKLPSYLPTQQPSLIPTSFPTSSPTFNPSASPTELPSISPSSHLPTASPTLSPSKVPTFSPSVLPSFNPSKSPTESPTQQPSGTPTISPTFMPIPNAEWIIETIVRGDNCSSNSSDDDILEISLYKPLECVPADDQLSSYETKCMNGDVIYDTFASPNCDHRAAPVTRLLVFAQCAKYNDDRNPLYLDQHLVKRPIQCSIDPIFPSSFSVSTPQNSIKQWISHSTYLGDSCAEENLRSVIYSANVTVTTPPLLSSSLSITTAVQCINNQLSYLQFVNNIVDPIAIRFEDPTDCKALSGSSETGPTLSYTRKCEWTTSNPVTSLLFREALPHALVDENSRYVVMNSFAGPTCEEPLHEGIFTGILLDRCYFDSRSNIYSILRYDETSGNILLYRNQTTCVDIEESGSLSTTSTAMGSCHISDDGISSHIFRFILTGDSMLRQKLVTVDSAYEVEPISDASDLIVHFTVRPLSRRLCGQHDLPDSKYSFAICLQGYIVYSFFHDELCSELSSQHVSYISVVSENGVQKNVLETCISYVDLDPTMSPTLLSEYPTETPSCRPSRFPTTLEPSHEPSLRPSTRYPTVNPSIAPSAPTETPTTEQPTKTPTFVPTSRRPTRSPTTLTPTYLPSSTPTRGLPRTLVSFTISQAVFAAEETLKELNSTESVQQMRFISATAAILKLSMSSITVLKTVTISMEEETTLFRRQLQEDRDIPGIIIYGISILVEDGDGETVYSRVIASRETALLDGSYQRELDIITVSSIRLSIDRISRVSSPEYAYLRTREPSLSPSNTDKGVDTSILNFSSSSRLPLYGAVLMIAVSMLCCLVAGCFYVIAHYQTKEMTHCRGCNRKHPGGRPKCWFGPQPKAPTAIRRHPHPMFVKSGSWEDSRSCRAIKKYNRRGARGAIPNYIPIKNAIPFEKYIGKKSKLFDTPYGPRLFQPNMIDSGTGTLDIEMSVDFDESTSDGSGESDGVILQLHTLARRSLEVADDHDSDLEAPLTTGIEESFFGTNPLARWNDSSNSLTPRRNTIAIIKDSSQESLVTSVGQSTANDLPQSAGSAGFRPDAKNRRSSYAQMTSVTTALQPPVSVNFKSVTIVALACRKLHGVDESSQL